MTVNNFITSPAGIKFIHNFEGTRKNLEGLHVPYKDTANKLTIGHGHLLTAEELESGLLSFNRESWTKGITDDTAMKLFKVDLRRFEIAMNELNDFLILQHQFDALVSFSFNLGIDAYRTSTLRQVIHKNGTNEQITYQFNRWVHSGGVRTNGLVRRRAAEALLYTTGKYS